MQFTREQQDKLSKFFKDPDWSIVQKALGEKIIELEGLRTIDATKPAEDVKAQVIGHQIARNILVDFFGTCGMISAEDFTTGAQSDADFN